MTAMSRFRMCENSWAMTPSSSSSSRIRMIPVVAQTAAWFFERPVAKALGTFESATATFGFGTSACWARRSTIACSFGYSSGVTSLAPMLQRVSRSEK